MSVCDSPACQFKVEHVMKTRCVRGIYGNVKHSLLTYMLFDLFTEYDVL